MNKAYALLAVGAVTLLVMTKPRAQVSAAVSRPANGVSSTLAQIGSTAAAASSALAAGQRAVSAVTGNPAPVAAVGAGVNNAATVATINGAGGAIAQSYIQGAQFAAPGSINVAGTSQTLSGGVDLFSAPVSVSESLVAGESVVGAVGTESATNIGAASIESGAGLGFAQAVPFLGIALVAFTAKKPPPETAESNARAYGVDIAAGEEIRADHAAGVANERDIGNWWEHEKLTGQDEYLYRLTQNAGS